MGRRAELDEATINADTPKQYVEAVAKVVKNKPMTYIFGGEEVAIEGEDGSTNIWIKPVLAGYGFVGTVEEFPEYADRAEKNKDKLLKKLEVPVESVTAGTTSASSELGW